MKMFRPVSLALSLAVLAGCATQPAGSGGILHANGMTGMPATSQTGPEFSREMHFGDYATIAVKPVGAPPTCLSDCQRSTHFLGTVDFQEDFRQRYFAAIHKYSFMQEGVDGQELLVHTIDEPRRIPAATSAPWFGQPEAFDTSLVGAIDLPADDKPAWRFALLAEATPQAAGWLLDDHGHRVVLKSLPAPRRGFAFELDGQAIGSVDLLAPNLVWIKDELAPDVKLALASFSSSMLLRSTVR